VKVCRHRRFALSSPRTGGTATMPLAATLTWHAEGFAGLAITSAPAATWDAQQFDQLPVAHGEPAVPEVTALKMVDHASPLAVLYEPMCRNSITWKVFWKMV
jgi:hypothetical protein